jgi:GNAT superfamily N-acetyltransferase
VDLVVEDDPDPRDVATIEAKLTAATARATGHADETQLAVFVRDDDGTVVGGIYGWTWGGTCELQHLWVDETRRGAGIGRALIDAAEAEAVRRGCDQVVLLTHAAHAGPEGEVWRRRGYELVGRVDDYPRGDAALWLRKALTSR